MSRVNLSVAPYYDDTDINKQFYQLLAIPGRVAQAREITALQTTLREIIKSVGDSILKNGDIIEGCQVLVNGNTVTVTSGKVYVEGIVMPLEESTVTIKGVGTEIIGVELMEVIVDEDIDPVTGKDTLRDPAQGYDNFNQPGCNRLKRYLRVVVDEPSSVAIATLIDGGLMVETYAPDYDVLTQTLARRTYDESGSYIVEGLNSRVEYLDETRYNLVVESGKAYVLGYELKIPTARRVSVNKSTTYNTVTRSNNRYSTGTSNYHLNSSHFVKSIISVNGPVSAGTSQSISTNTDRRQLPSEGGEVIEIISVTQGNKTFTIGNSASEGDCYLQPEGEVYYLKWNGTNNYPTLGSAYNVTYHHTKNFSGETDYELTTINGEHYLTWKPEGNSPVSGELFTVVFDQYLARKDLVYLDKYGVISVLEGAPAQYGFEVLPEAPLNTLTLAYINNPPNGEVKSEQGYEVVSINNVGLKRFTMNDIQNLLNRVQTIQYDQAVLSLDDDARQIETTNDKKGILTDSLIDLSRIDFYYNLSNTGEKINTGLPIYDMTLDLACNICYLPVVTNTYDSTNGLTYDATNSTVTRYNRLVSLKKSGENVVLSQSNATKSFLINPYSMFPQMPEVSIDPAIDNWIEDTIIEVPRSISDSSVVSMSSRNISTSKTLSGYFQRYTVNSSSVVDTPIGTKTETYTNESVLEERAITYIRQREITVEGNNFSPELDKIKCYFDGVRVDLTPLETTQSDGEGGVKADSNGYVKAKFRIPSGILTGTREVLLKSDIIREGEITEGFALYVASGMARRIERTVTTVTTVLLERVTTTTSTTYIDPVGQTFVLDRMTLLSGIDLYFESKPSVNTPVTCEIREVNNGMITSTVYASKTLRPSAINISNDASVATRFTFDDPVLLEENREYSFVIRSTSDAYRVWVAELGGIEVSTKGSNNPQTILRNPYMTGVMMSSSNNSSWTSHQTTDVKFRLIEDTYEQNSMIVYNTLSVEEAARLYLTADAAIPSGTEINWSYSVDGTNYLSITPYNLALLNNLQNSVTLRASLSRRSDSRLSPLLALDTVSLTASHYDTEGCYVSRNTTNLDPYTEVKIIMDVYEGSAGNSFNVRVSTDGGETLIPTIRSTKVTPLNYGWQEVTYEGTVPSSTQFRVFIEASSDVKFRTPAFRRLRCIMS